MSSKKIVTGDYTIQSLNGKVNIIGDLVVTGNHSAVENTTISDNVITLNAGETNANGITPTYTTVGAPAAGIEIARGGLATVSLIYVETGGGADGVWKYTNDGSVFHTIGSGGGGGGGGLNYVSDDSAPELGGNLNVHLHTIYSSNKQVVLGLNTPANGGTGLFVTNSLTTNAELVTNKKALTYSIIFG